MSHKRPRDDSDSDDPPPLMKIGADSDDESAEKSIVDDSDGNSDNEEAPFLSEGTLMEPFTERDTLEGDGSVDEAHHDEQATEERDKDAWLDSLDEKQGTAIDTKAFKAAHKAIESRSSFWDDTKPAGSALTIDDLLERVIGLLNNNENPRQAMDRYLGRSNTASANPKVKGIRARKREDQTANSLSRSTAKDMKSFEVLTEIVDGLISHGLVNALDERRDVFLQRLGNLKRH